MLDRPGHVRGGVKDAHWSGGDQLASTLVSERSANYSRRRTGRLALDCPEAPDECVAVSTLGPQVRCSRYHGCDNLQLSSHDRRGGERIANQRPTQLGFAGFSDFKTV